MGQNVIRDGYEMTAFVEAVPRLYEAVTFKFRPMLAEHVERLDDKLVLVTRAQQVVLLCGMLAERVTEWDVTDTNGAPAVVGLESMRRLPHPLIFRMAGIVRLLKPSDAVPKDAQEVDETTRLLEGYGALEESLRGN